MKKKRIVGIDLFCGIGGLTNGLVKSGIEILAGFDIDETCRKSFEQKLNNSPKFIKKDIRELEKNDLLSFFLQNTYKIIAGCAPCQPYSSHQKLKSFSERMKHDSYGLIEQYLRIVNLIKPEFVIMENVSNLKNDPFFKDNFLNYFMENNYHFDYKDVNIADYGAPQRRKRLLFIAVSKDIPNAENIMIPKKINAKSKNVFDVIGHLPIISDGSSDIKDPLHTSAKLSELNKKRIIASKEGGTWKDWPESLLLDCYKKPSGATYTSVYGRIKRTDVAPTLTTQFTRYGTGRYGHYEQNRALSLREGALLQTFPENYFFDLSLGMTSVARQIGNAVPPILAEKIGNIIFNKMLGETTHD
uniref:Cytosine-specific methyltransferase n=1 Tax=Spiroplasma citri TaxID=2133 RepID=Q14M96_SPICI|nr:hypothetical c-5 cytosine-specific dna methyltransferase protein [Spiroplasma citri]